MASKHSNAANTELHEAEGSMRAGWPALVLTVAMVLAAVYSFLPRAYPPFPVTRVHADNFLANGLARQGARYVVVGEGGNILYADKPDGPWGSAVVEPARGSTLTRVRFVAKNTAIAVGHDAWIVRSDDAGKSWHEVHFNADSSDPLLDIGGPYSGRLFAVGSFGQMMVSQDLGKTWQAHPLNVVAPEQPDAAAEPGQQADAADPESDDYDPFAAYTSGGGAQALAARHLNSITRLDDGSLFIAGERGLLLRSADHGDTWNQLDDIYDGSFYGALNTPDGGVLVYGMRGHAFVSHDQGKTWQASEVPGRPGLFSGTITDDGTILLVGASDTILASSDNGASFQRVVDGESAGLVSILPLAKNRWLTAGEDGVAIQQPAATAKAGNETRS